MCVKCESAGISYFGSPGFYLYISGAGIIRYESRRFKKLLQSLE